MTQYPPPPTPPPYYGDPAYQGHGGAYPGSSKRIAAGVCGILLGALGVHKFIYGATTAGLIMLLVTLLTCGVLSPIMGIIGLIEGIMYLTKSDEEFYIVYEIGKKAWF